YQNICGMFALITCLKFKVIDDDDQNRRMPTLGRESAELFVITITEKNPRSVLFEQSIFNCRVNCQNRG
ncbi:hypothetical protein BLOT_007823, partial [Blomia tropicalis]